MAFVTDSNRPQPLWQPPPTACLTASEAALRGPFPSTAPLHSAQVVRPYRRGAASHGPGDAPGGSGRGPRARKAPPCPRGLPGQGPGGAALQPRRPRGAHPMAGPSCAQGVGGGVAVKECGSTCAECRGAVEGKGPRRRPPEAVGQAVGGGCQSGHCRLQMPLRLALGVRVTVAGRRLGALEGGRGGVPPALPMHRWRSGSQGVRVLPNPRHAPQLPPPPRPLQSSHGLAACPCE